MRLAVNEDALPKFAIPEKILIADSIAKTSVGKLKKKQFRQDYGKV